MIRREGDRMRVSGPMTLGHAAALLREGSAAIGEGVRVVDLSGAEELDSSALALLLAWLRQARGAQRELQLENLPQGLTSIARLYGVSELLPAGPAAASHH